MLAPGRAETVIATGQKGLGRRRCSLRQRVHLRDFNDQHTHNFEDGVFAGDVGQPVSKPRIVYSQCPQSLRLLFPLRPFQHQHVIDLGAGLVNAGNCWDQISRPNRTNIFTVVDVKICLQPAA